MTTIISKNTLIDFVAVLNVYFWLTDEHNKLDVINQIGFVPERIVLFGDSAGGNQAMSLLMALNDVRQQFPNCILYCALW